MCVMGQEQREAGKDMEHNRIKRQFVLLLMKSCIFLCGDPNSPVPGEHCDSFLCILNECTQNISSYYLGDNSTFCSLPSFPLL